MEACLQMVEDLREDPAYNADYDVVTDVTGLDRQYTRKEMARMSWIPLSPKKVAIVAPDLISFGMSRMYEMMIAGEQAATVRVFRDRISAIRWLGKTEQEVAYLLAQLEHGPCERRVAEETKT